VDVIFTYKYYFIYTYIPLSYVFYHFCNIFIYTMAITTSSTTTASVVFTRAASRIALPHILDNFMVRPNINNAFSKAGINDTVGLLTLDDKAIKGLVYSHTDSNGVTTTQKLQRGDVGLLKSFIHYEYHRDNR
jgi:hypothetical protein